MASGIARGRVRTTTTGFRNMAVIFQIIGWQDMQPWFTVYVFDIECVRCHAIENKIKNHASDKVKKL